MLSPLSKKRLAYKPELPALLKDLKKVHFVSQKGKTPSAKIKHLFPRTFEGSYYKLQKGIGEKKKVKIGVVFSGGPAAGGHNVITALFDAGASLIGFLNGPDGIIKNKSKEITSVDSYRNQGGFDLLGSGRNKIETEEQLAASLKTVKAHKLDGLVIIGGDDSNTNAAILAEYFSAHGSKTKVVGVPKTIDGDLRTKEIEISFGFDSASKTYAELIGNICKDALSSRKYYHFIRVMGRSASHIAMECALLTQPNVVLISEEKKNLNEIVSHLADLIEKRASKGKEFGVVIVPEGLIEFIPEQLKGMDLERDPHGNINVSKIETEKLLIDLVEKELKKRKFAGKFNTFAHFLGYEGRCCLPSNFDANYCYALGLTAYLAVRDGLNGVICAVRHLNKAARQWAIEAVPLVQLIHLEKRKGVEKPVIAKALVDVKSKKFTEFRKQSKKWEMDDCYLTPGPIQFYGDIDSVPITMGGL